MEVWLKARLKGVHPINRLAILEVGEDLESYQFVVPERLLIRGSEEVSLSKSELEAKFRQAAPVKKTPLLPEEVSPDVVAG